jgi:hypothetical protein
VAPGFGGRLDIRRSLAPEGLDIAEAQLEIDMARAGISATNIKVHFVKLEDVKVIVEKGPHCVLPVPLPNISSRDRQTKPGRMREIKIAQAKVTD